MAHRAISEPGVPQVVDRGRNRAYHRLTRPYAGGCRDIGVAFQTEVAHLGPDHHPRIRRAVRLMAGAAAFQPHGRVFERKGPALFGVALKAGFFVRVSRFQRSLAERPVRVVSIRAGHRAFRKLVPVWPLELRPHRSVAGLALVVDRRRLARNHVGRIFVYGVALVTGHLILRVSALHPRDMSGCAHVARHADLLGSGRNNLRGIPDVGRVRRLGVFGSGSMAGLARLPFPSPLVILLYCRVRILLKRLENVLMASLARFRTHIRRWPRGRSFFLLLRFRGFGLLLRKDRGN
jgi:hypothetical protein